MPNQVTGYTSIIEVIDDAGAATGAVPNAGATDDATLTFAVFSGYAYVPPPGHNPAGGLPVVDLFADGQLIGSGYVPMNGIVSITTAALPLGTHEIVAKVTSYPSGGGAPLPEPSEPFTVTIVPDAAPAPDPIPAPAESDFILQVFSADRSGRVLNLDGEAAAGAHITVLHDGVVLGSTTAGSDGAWTLDIQGSPNLLRGKMGPLEVSDGESALALSLSGSNSLQVSTTALHRDQGGLSLLGQADFDHAGFAFA